MTKLTYDTPAGNAFTSITPDGLSCATINQFIVIALSAVADQFTVQWCAIGDPTSWPTPNTDAARAVQAGSQELPNKFGVVTALAGGDFYGYVFQERAITKMTYVGGDIVFAFDTFSEGVGCFSRNRAVTYDEAVFFEGEFGYYTLINDVVTDIGQGAVTDSYPPT